MKIRDKLDNGEWVMLNVNIHTHHQHFVLLKPMLKTVVGRHGHVVYKGEANGLCAFSTALRIAQAGGLFELDEAGMSHPQLEHAREEFNRINKIDSIASIRDFSALMGVASLHEYIATHLNMKAGHNPQEAWPNWLTGHRAFITARDRMDTVDRANCTGARM